MTNPGGHTAAQAVWDEQSVWSQAADRLKRGIDRARSGALALGIAAAVFGTAAAQLMGWSQLLGGALAFGAALAAGVTPLLAGRAGPAAIERWTRLRSVSEAMKNEGYAFLAGVSSYRGAGATEALRRRVEELRAEASELLPETLGLRPVPRVPPPVTDVGSYLEHRLLRQIDGYYRPRAELMRRRLVLVRRAELALGIAGAALGALAGAFGAEQAAAWVAVTATVAATLSAHSLAAKYQSQQVVFVRAADALRRLLDEWSAGRAARGPDAEDAFVRRCEAAIAGVNEEWVTKWTAQ
ncbi:DUF4231 domain-containing protein [Streptomyces johnsoniae]|uniref:DUF4231 domain-containing protein n=1 Tax=Streptomyces johnsoniae TaxID=3075532 RepID=A0ABU2S1D0_9ACTN|nr:DUF4231 domain-containing protein [Streptomyces sp. DSM 41886]MDT0442249.1 DUF4231 domain-containing protein [Streptomyces sp. DSM 41886]